MSTVGPNLFVIAVTCAGLAFAHARWRARFAGWWEPAGPAGRRVTWGILVLQLLAQIQIGGGRDLSALATQGPSAQNLAQAAVLGFAALWAFHLVARGHVRRGTAQGGPAFWISALVGVYLVSTAWSVWPTLTLYRAVELGVFFVLVLHLCATSRWLDTVRSLLWLAVATSWLAQLWYLDLSAPPDRVIGFAYDNASTLLAAALFLVELHRTLWRPTPRGWALVGVACGSVLAFGSLATSAALAVAGLALLVGWGEVDRRGREVAMVGVLVAATTVGAVLLSPADQGDDLVAEIAELTGRDVSGIQSLTGRVPLWQAIAEATADEPLGLGYAGGERALALDVVEVEEVGWRAGHAHNGYLSGWLGAGWPGLALVLAVFASAWRHAGQLPADRRAVFVPLLVLLTVNNVTAAAVGGQLGAGWMVMMALAVAPPRAAAATPPTPLGQTEGTAHAGRAPAG